MSRGPEPPIVEMHGDEDIDLMRCPYYQRAAKTPGHDPEGICDRGCYEEPACMTSMWPVPLRLEPGLNDIELAR